MTLSFNTIKSAFDSAQKELFESDANVANMSTPGYSRHTPLLEAQIDRNGRACGVQVSEVRREIDQELFNRYQRANSQAELLKVQSEYLENLQSSFGRWGRGDDVVNELADVFNELDRASGEPENPSLTKFALDKLSQLTLQINDVANRVQDARLKADRDIFESVAILNGLLKQYHQTNDAIVFLKARGQDPLDLKSQRDHLFFQISTYLPVRESPQNTGRNWLYLKGALLVKNEEAVELDFENVSYITPESTRDSSGAGLQDLHGIKIGTRDITDLLDAGKLHGLFQLRDVLLPDIQAQLDEFAVGLRDQFNSHHARGTAFQAPQVVTGNRPFTGPSDALGGTGTFRFAVITKDKRFDEYRDIDLATTPTIGDLMAEILAGGKASALLVTHPFDPTKKALEIKANNTQNGLAFVSLDPSDPAIETGTGLGISQFLGLSDMLVSEGKFAGGVKTGVANVLSVNPALLQNPERYAHGMLDTTAIPVLAGNANETVALTSGDNRNSQSIARSVDELWNFDAAGGIFASKDTLKNFAVRIIQTNAQNASIMQKSFTNKNNVFLHLKESVAEKSGVSQKEEVLKHLKLSDYIDLCTGAFENLRKVKEIMTKLLVSG